MHRVILLRIMSAICLLLMVASCKKDSKLKLIKFEPSDFPSPNAGKDTTIYYPISSYNLNGSASTGNNSSITSYKWKMLSGPSTTAITDSNNVTSTVMNLINVGYYSFELTVTNAFKLSAKDTVNVTILAPACFTNNNGIIFKDMIWNTSWMMEIDIDKIYSLLPPGSQLKNIYIKRDGLTDWEKVVPLNTDSPDYTFHTWIFGNGGLAIFPSEDDMRVDTPDVKIEYCP